MRCGTLNVRGQYREGSFTAAARELARYKLDLVGVQEVRWDKRAQEGQGINFFYGKGKKKIGNRIFIQQNSISCLRERSLLVIWCNIVLNVHAPSEEKSDNSKDSFYEELEQVFDHFPKYHMKIILGDFNAKVGRVNIF